MGAVGASDSTRYETIMQACSTGQGDLPAQFAQASRAARAAFPAASEREAVIRDIAAGVAAPALTAFAIWLMDESRLRGLRRLRFLSRDGQAPFELAQRLVPAGDRAPDLEYVYSSRLTWSLAATDPRRLAEAPWLLNSFVKSNAADVCARLGLPFLEYRELLQKYGVSLDPGMRADQPTQAAALRQFAAAPEVAEVAETRIAGLRRLVTKYAAQHQLAEADTGLVDIGWTGRMVGSFIELCEAAGMSRPTVLFWGHEPRATGWTAPCVASYMYNTAAGQRLQWRVPDAPFIMETFAMADHGIVSGYREDSDGTVLPELTSPANEPAAAWGLGLYRSVLLAFAAALGPPEGIARGDLRPVIHQVLDAFWCRPTRAEALAWGSYPYDSDPAGSAVRPLARPFTAADHTRGDRAWLAGSLALSNVADRERYLASAPESELAGAPETD
jgi:hypothetical protein